MTDNNSSNSIDFGDTKAHQAVSAIYNRIRAAIETIAYRQPTLVNLTRQVQGFIPLLKRTDKDEGGLPFYSKAYTSQKTNREHCLMCILSFLVQEFWDYKESTEEFGEDRLKNLEVQLALLEAIAADGLSIYRVTGKFPHYHLITKAELDDEEARERLLETLKQEQMRDDEEDYQAAVDHETGADLDEEEAANDEEEREDNLEGAIVGGDSVIAEEETISLEDLEKELELDDEEEISMETATGETVDGINEQLDEAARHREQLEAAARRRDQAARQAQDDINTTPPMPQG